MELEYQDWARLQGILIEIRFIKFNLTSRAYQTKSSPLEGRARPRALKAGDHARADLSTAP